MWERFGYESVLVVSQGSSINPDPRKLKETILQTRRFRGLQGDILFDGYGDNQRKPLLFKVKNGVFVKFE